MEFKKEVRKGEELPLEHPVIKKKIDKALDISIKQGSSVSAMNSLSNSYFTPYALALNASSSQIGIMNALINLLPSMFQLKSSKLVGKHKRKNIALTATLLQALIFIPILFAIFLYLKGFQHTVWFLIFFVSLFYILPAISHPAWFSWMGSLVNENSRGAYFSKRNKLAGICGLLALIMGGLILDRFKIIGMTLVGFGVIFCMAFIFRIIGCILLIKQYEPRLKINKHDYFTLTEFLRGAKESAFGRFTIFASIMRIATNIASPFFAVYLLKELNLSYAWFMAITVSGALFHIIFWPLQGKISDKYGNIILLRVSCLLFAMFPFSLFISKNPGYLLLVPQMIGGFGWAGFTLATNNYIYDALRQEQRSYGLAYFNFLTSLGMFVGAGIGALLVLIEVPFMSSLLFVFLISGILRVLAYLPSSKYLKEVRHVKRFKTQYIIREFSPAQGLVREYHRFNRFKEGIMHFA